MTWKIGRINGIRHGTTAFQFDNLYKRKPPPKKWMDDFADKVEIQRLIKMQVLDYLESQSQCMSGGSRKMRLWKVR